jgi:hypothetical protein
MKLAGWILIVAGALVALVAILLPTSVPTDGYEIAAAAGLPMPSTVSNLGLMLRQLVVLQIGLAAFLGGCVLLGAGHVAEVLAWAGGGGSGGGRLRRRAASVAAPEEERVRPAEPEEDQAGQGHLQHRGVAIIALAAFAVLIGALTSH